MSKIYNIAVIGAGPIGLSTAIEGVIGGMNPVIVFEKMPEHSHTIRKFYKDNKRVDKEYKGIQADLVGNIDFEDGTKESTLEFFDELIAKHQLEILYETNIDKVVKNEAEDLFTIYTGSTAFQAKNVVIGIGNMGKPNKPTYRVPPAVRDKVNYNTEKCQEGEKILVVGGGNSAAEYAYDLREQGAVTLNYRKREFTRLNDQNLENITQANTDDTLHLKLGIDIVALEESEGKIKVIFDDDSDETFDRIVYAIGGTLPSDFLKSCGVELEADGKMPIFDEHYQCTTKGLFIGGDLVTKKGGSIALGMTHAYDIVQYIQVGRG